MSSESDFELPDNLVVHKGPSVHELQRKEIEALRAQVLDAASENTILKARMRDIDDIYARRLSEQVSQQLEARRAQVQEIEQIKRNLGATEQKNKLLSVEIKTLEAKQRRALAPTAPLAAVPTSTLGDGFQVKKRRFEQQPRTDMAPKCRSALANLTNKAGYGVLSELSDTDSAKLVGLDSPEAIAHYLCCMEPARPSLSLLGITLGFCREEVDLSPVSDRLLGLLNNTRSLPSVYSDGSIVLSKADVNALIVVIYSLDVLVNAGYTVPLVIVDNLLKSSCCLFIYYGLLLAENQGLGDSFVVADLPTPELCIEMLFGSMWDSTALDDSVLKSWSHECFVLEWAPEYLEPLANWRLKQFTGEYNLQLVRTLCTISQPELKAMKRVVSLLCLYNEQELVYQCVRFLWRVSTDLGLSTQVVTRLAQVASTNAKAKGLALNVLGQLVTPTEYEQLKGVMEF